MFDNSDNREGLPELFFRTQLLLHRLEAIQFREFGPMGSPHRGQGRVLSILKLQPEISQKQLSYLLHMRNQSLGELLAKLEKAGMITRTPSQEDKRAMIIRLTETGKSAADTIEEIRNTADMAFDSLAESERENLRELLMKIIGWLDAKLEGEEPPPPPPFFPPFAPPFPPPYFGMNPFAGTPYNPWHRHDRHHSRGVRKCGHADDGDSDAD